MRMNGAVVLGVMLAAGLAMGADPYAAPDPQPLAVPQATRPFEPQGRPLEGLVITLDAGHGGSSHQPGYSGSARGVNSRVVEGDLNILVASQLRHHLIDAGATVHMTRLDDRKVAPGDTDRATELGSRQAVAKATASHLFLSLHHNSTDSATADGVVILIWPTDSKGADQPLERAMADVLREEVEKGVHHGREYPHYVIDHPLVSASDIPSAVIEFGFLSNADFDAWVSRPGSHREEAQAAYNGIVRLWTEQRAALEAKRAELFPDAGPVVPRAEEDADGAGAAQRLARRLNPFGVPITTPDQAQLLVDAYKSDVLSDSRSFYLSASVARDRDGWQLTGSTNMPRLATGLAGMLEAAGCTPLRNAVATLPADRLGAAIFGVVQIPMALTWAAPREGASVQTQVLLGEPVFLLDETPDGTYVLINGFDGYVGWTRSETVRRMDAAEFQAWESPNRVRVVRETMVDTFRIPTGAVLPIESVGDDSVVVRLPRGVRATDGEPQATVPRDHVLLPQSPMPGQVAAATAVQYLTVPYVFGGRSALGLDCSGLTGVAWATTGVQLPRDADQQALMGRLVATPWHRDGMLPGDQLFFIDASGDLYHTGISLGGSRFIHASPPEVQVSSFDPADPLYSKGWTEAFAFGRRHGE